MKEQYYYIQDVDGTMVVDQFYMDNHFDPETQRVLMQGTAKQVQDYLNWLYNTDII